MMGHATLPPPRAGTAHPRPFWLESGGAHLACWLHAPAPESPRPAAAVVLCGPIGHEYAHSYRSLLHLAEALRAEGIPVLRFDYHGCGASEGDALSPGLVSRWVEDTRRAVAWLSEWADAPVTLVGLRAGATIAALATEDAAVENVVAWAPVVRGRRYVREQTALSGFGTQPAEAGAGFIEAGGFVFSDETRKALGAADLRKLPWSIGGRVLIVERDDVEETHGLADALAAQEIGVDVLTPTGYAAMMDEPHFTVVPQDAVRGIASWIAERAGSERAVTPEPAVCDLPVAYAADNGEEQLVIFSEDPALFGVLTRPPEARATGRVVVLLNAGSVHQVGPNRVYVELARTLAAAGEATFRLDLRNLGDSLVPGAPEENQPYPATAIEDAARAVAWLTGEGGFRHVVLGGLCSGAHTAFHGGLTIEEAALDEIVMINPLTFYFQQGMSLKTPSAYAVFRDSQHYGRAIRNPRSWLRLAGSLTSAKEVARFVRRAGSKRVAQVVQESLEKMSLKGPKLLGRDLLRFRERGRRVRMIFSRSDPGYPLLMASAGVVVRRMLEEGSLVIEFIEDADHTFSVGQRRVELGRCLVAGLEPRTATAR